jgi:hypothetical protein
LGAGFLLRGGKLNNEWIPNPKQRLALELRQVRELFYGGARGGGKTDYLLIDFLNGINEWGEYWIGILFRHSYKQLEEVIRRAHQIYVPLGAEWHKADMCFTFQSGSVLKLSYLENDSDCENYQGHSYTWIGFDELGNYRTDYAWVTMMMCLRSAHVGEDWLRMRGTGNPGGVGHRWLKQRFIEGREPCKVYATPYGVNSKNEPLVLTSAFVPATAYDNENLLKNNPAYIANLKAQPERVRQAMLEGRWDIKGGGEFFDEFDETKHIMPPKILSGDWKRFYALDWGRSKPWAVVKVAVDKDGKVVVYGELYGQGLVDGVEKENVGDHKTSEEVARMVAKDMAAEGVTMMIADYSIWNSDNGTNCVADAFRNAGIVLLKSVKERKRGWQLIHNLLSNMDEFGTPYLRIFSTCKYLIREMENIQCDKNDMEDCDSRQSDHALDALRYALYSQLYHYQGIKNEPARAAGQKTAYVHDPVKSRWGKK